MTPDVALNKKESIERCVRQARIYYGMPSDKPFEQDFFKQDVIGSHDRVDLLRQEIIHPSHSA